jgi:hypothetical protein
MVVPPTSTTQIVLGEFIASARAIPARMMASDSSRPRDLSVIMVVFLEIFASSLAGMKQVA